MSEVSGMKLRKLQWEVDWWCGRCLLDPMIQLIVCNPADYDAVCAAVDKHTDEVTEGFDSGLEVMTYVAFHEVRVEKDPAVPRWELKAYEKAENYYRMKKGGVVSKPGV